MKYPKITICVYDTGFFIPLAVRLVEDFGKVYYCFPTDSGYMEAKNDAVGTGIKSIHKIDENEFWEVKDKIDLFIFPDCVFGGLQEELKRQGKLVWGFGKSSWMEQDRIKFREWQEDNDMPVPETEEFIGIENLKEGLKKEQFVKISKYRYDMETIKHFDKIRSEQRFDELKVKLGILKNTLPFTVEEKIEGIEIGYDGWTVDGQFPKYGLWGIEIKDCGYLGKITDTFPKQIDYVNGKLSPLFKKEKVKAFYSNEMRIDKKRDAYLIDMTCRCPNPPYQLHCLMWDNLAEIIYEGAKGNLVVPKAKAKYGAVAIINSDFAAKNWLALDVPEKVRPYTFIMNMCMYKNEIYTVPVYELSEIGAVVGIGNTMEEAIKMCKANAEQIKGDSLEIDVDSLDKATETFKEARSYGIIF